MIINTEKNLVLIRSEMTGIKYENNILSDLPVRVIAVYVKESMSFDTFQVLKNCLIK